MLPARGESAHESAAAEPGQGLRVDDVSVSFEGLLALDGVTLGVDPGKVVGVIGPNGAGKTTLFNVICGFVRPDRGAISWRSESLAGVRPHTLPRADRIDRRLRDLALGALERFGARDAAGERADSLPYGVQKRVALARALVANPELLLLDEPAGGLGVDDLTELADAIRELKGSMSVMLVEHRMDLVMSVSDEVAVLDSGRLIASGTPDEVRADPAVLEAYLGAEEESADA